LKEDKEDPIPGLKCFIFYYLLLESHLFQPKISLNTLKRWQDFDYLFRLHAKQSVPLRFFSPQKNYSDKSQTANTAVV